MIEKLFQISPETSLLYSRVRSERNQSSGGGGNESGGGAGSAGRSNNGQSAAGGSSGGAGNPSGSGGGVGGSASSDRDSFSRWRDRQYYGPRRWFQRDDSAWDKEAAGK